MLVEAKKACTRHSSRCVRAKEAAVSEQASFEHASFEHASFEHASFARACMRDRERARRAAFWVRTIFISSKAIKKKYDAETVKLKPPVVVPVGENQVVVGDVPLVMVPPPKERSHIGDDINFQEHDILPTSRTADTYSSSGDIYDHDPADANLVMTLLGELQDLVGPKFGLFGPDLRDSLCDALARVFTGALSHDSKLKLMHQIHPDEFNTFDKYWDTLGTDTDRKLTHRSQNDA